MELRQVVAIVVVLVSSLVTHASARTSSYSDVNYDVTCTNSMMKVTVNMKSNSSLLYLDSLKGFPGCQPEMGKGKAVFKLSLEDIYTCATTRMLNKLTGQKIYYNRVIIEHPNKIKEVILAKCVIPGDAKRPAVAKHERYRRQQDSLPVGFEEEEIRHADIKNLTYHAPVPILNAVLRQNGRVLDSTVSVQPGTPLEMLIYLDSVSSSVYGLLASYLKVTDNTPEKEEIIILNGCSIDPYIFGNFDTPDAGDTLSAKFRAFKFPDTNYVQFVGTANVCLKECQGVPCGNGIYGYGRKKREIPAELPADPNKIYEAEVTTFLRVEFSDDLFKLKRGNLSGKFITHRDDQDVEGKPTGNTDTDKKLVIDDIDARQGSRGLTNQLGTQSNKDSLFYNVSVAVEGRESFMGQAQPIEESGTVSADNTNRLALAQKTQHNRGFASYHHHSDILLTILFTLLILVTLTRW